MKKFLSAIGFTIFVGSMIVGCSKKESAEGNVEADSNTLTIVAGSEIEAIKPLIQEASTKLGFPIEVKYTGTIEGVESVKSGAAYDVAWFGNAKYFYDTPESSKRIKLSEKIMFSPVIVGVRADSFSKSGLSESAIYTWKDIAGWVKNKNMTYAMTDPSVSNSGYVALMGVVYATTNKGENITLADVNKDVLQSFFKGQKVTAKSSNWLMDTFNKESNIDFIVNYESAILNNPNKLVAVYPNEGIITSDYPMLLLNDKKTDKYKALVQFMKSKEVQTRLVNEYKYRSGLPGVMQSQQVFDTNKLLVEMPFNPDADVSESILMAYFNEYKKPAKFAFVVDTSGSMGGEREAEMKQVVDSFAKGTISKFATIRNRESIVVVPFSTQVGEAQTFNDKQKAEFNAYIQNLRMDGGTAMYDGVATAIAKLVEDKKVNGDKYRYSVIVLTDGMSNEGANMEGFTQWFTNNKIESHGIRVFAISFGDSDLNQLNSVTRLSGGKVFDGKKNLSSAFREIRSYQ
jgi:Ca-activated chloride channel family protein